MGLKIVTGRTGEPHVTSRQMQAVYRSFLGDFALLDVGAHLAATATSNDNVRISDGVVAVQGIYAVIAYNEYDDNYIEPVSVGMKRIDTLILHYTKSNDIEDMQIEVVEGEEVVDNPVAPTIAEGGDAWEGTADIKVPIYDVLVTSFGLTVTPYSRMNTLIPTLDSIAERIPESIVTGVKGDSEALYRNGNVNITKENIGLGNVDNTADTDKPISTATQTALDLKASIDYVNATVASAYHAGGNLTVAELTSSLLVADNMGKVYNMSDSGVTTSDFVEGAGKPIREGDDIGICNRGTEENPIYKFNLLSGFVDLSAYATTSAVNDGLAGKVDKVAGKGLSTEDYTTDDKTKLAGIEAQANKTTVDSSMSTTSTNPLQNKVITAELAGATTATGNPLTIESSESNLVECVAEVEAVQDLHGYDHPWVGGAGKNKLHMTGSDETVSGVTYTKLLDNDSNVIGIKCVGTISGTSAKYLSTDVTLPAGTYILTGGSGVSSTGIRLIAVYSENDAVKYREATTEQGITFTLSAETQVAFYLRGEQTNLAVNTIIYPMIRLSTETDSTFEPYSNISPITGQTEVVIGDCGKNLFDVNNFGGKQDSSTTYSFDGNKLTITGKWYIWFYADVKPNTNYVFSRIIDSYTVARGLAFYGLNSDGTINESDQITGTSEIFNSGNRKKIAILLYSGNSTSGTTVMHNIQLEEGSTATTYEPYAGKTYTIQLGDTIYGGELDVITGELTVTHEYAEFDGSSDENWAKYSSGSASAYAMQTTLSNLIAVSDDDKKVKIIANELESVAYNGAWGEYDAFVCKNNTTETSGLVTGVRSITTVADWKTYLASNPLQVVYELAEPYTIQLTPQQIRLLKGTNNISCNTGDLSIKYYPDNVLGQLKGDIEDEYDERVETLETQVQELQPSLIFMSRERRDITSDLSRLSIAVAEQNLEKYGYKIGDYFERVDGNRTYTYHIADYNTFKGTSTPYCLTTNHIGIVVDTHATTQWYSGDASAVGYNGSTLHTYLKGTVLDNIKADMIYFFGGTTGLEHLLSHSKLLTTALANWGWQANQYISALTCTQIDAGSQWTANGFQEGEASKSLELFRKHKWTEIFESRYPWLRNLSNYSGGSYACFAANYGNLYGDGSVPYAYCVVGLIIFH